MGGESKLPKMFTSCGELGDNLRLTGTTRTINTTSTINTTGTSTTNNKYNRYKQDHGTV